MHQAHMNLAISGVHSVFIPSATEHSFVASKLIREIAKFGGDVTSMVPAPVTQRLAERFGR
jgi:pantetheine-phosphate adenylyltransferase